MWICSGWGVWAQGSTHQSFEQSEDPFLWPGWDQDGEPELLWGFGELVTHVISWLCKHTRTESNVGLGAVGLSMAFCNIVLLNT